MGILEFLDSIDASARKPRDIYAMPPRADAPRSFAPDPYAFGNLTSETARRAYADMLALAGMGGQATRSMLPEGVNQYIPDWLAQGGDYGLAGLTGLLGAAETGAGALGEGVEAVQRGMGMDGRYAPGGSARALQSDLMGMMEGSGFAPEGRMVAGLSNAANPLVRAGLTDIIPNEYGGVPIPGRASAPFDIGRGAPALFETATRPAINRVSTRLPTKGLEATAPMGSLVADTEAFLRNASAPQNLEMMTQTYPGMKRLLSSDPVETSENIVNRMKDNVGSLYDLAEAKGITEESSKWYDGANRIANDLGQRFGIQPEKSAGVLAVLSPQKDWYQNVGLGERIIKSFSEVNPQARWSPEMDKVAMTSAADKEGYTAWMRDKEFEEKVRGNSYGAMETPRQKAMWLRAYDEAQNGRNYREVAPNGDILDYAVTGAGNRRSIVPQSFENMAKAIRILEGDGSLDAISRELGDEHKVRNFFNNILTPSSPIDVTADTHQIAGGLLMPYGSSAPEVGHGLSGATAPKQGMPWSKSGSLETGTPGAYGLHFDATKRAAEERGWIPRQMQSITWEQLRALMPPGIRGNHPFVQKARDIWGAVDKGEITPEQARAAIIEQASAAGGGGMPTWVGYTGPRRSMLGGGAGLLGLIGGAGLASANEPPLGLLAMQPDQGPQ